MSIKSFITSLKNFKLYRKVLAQHPPHALYFSGMMEMFHFQLGLSLERRYNHPWIDKSTIPHIKRMLELLQHNIDNDFFTRVAGQSYEELIQKVDKSVANQFIAEASILKEEESEELAKLFKMGLLQELEKPI